MQPLAARAKSYNTSKNNLYTSYIPIMYRCFEGYV